MLSEKRDAPPQSRRKPVKQTTIPPAEKSTELYSEHWELAEPRAGAMIQSLRAFGYDLPAAIADLIDNSISAGAKNVWLDFHWSGEASHITITDDGSGMTEENLTSAMRPGSRSPLEERSPRDLGRFGLGLKTASFSQCRSLTVCSKVKNGTPALRRWDLDYVTECGQWRLLKTSSETFDKHALRRLQNLNSGTVVFWEIMDRVTHKGTRIDNNHDQDIFLRRVSDVQAQMALIFHRYLEGIPGRPFRIHINDQQIKAWNPFFKHDATMVLPAEELPFRGSIVTVSPFVLPHHSKLTKAQYSEAAGPRGWDAQQGFYVYRNKRLLVGGDWLGFFQREQHCKLARIAVDLPNSLDDCWEIDVKKSRAWPPPSLRKDLSRLGSATRNQATDIYRHRGARLIQAGTGQITFLWESKKRREKIFYEINREHPIVRSALSGPQDQVNKIRALLSLIEETVPIPTITMDTATNPDQHAKPFEEAPPSALRKALSETYRILLGAGMKPAEAKVRLMNLEPFSQFREAVAALDEN